MNTIVKGEPVLFKVRVKDINVSQRETWTLIGTVGGTIVFSVDGHLYSQTFDTDISTTLSIFQSKHQDELLNKGVIVTQSGDQLSFLVLDPERIATFKGEYSGTSGIWVQNVDAGFVDLTSVNDIKTYAISSDEVILKKFSYLEEDGYGELTITMDRDWETNPASTF